MLSRWFLAGRQSPIKVPDVSGMTLMNFVDQTINAVNHYANLSWHIEHTSALIIVMYACMLTYLLTVFGVYGCDVMSIEMLTQSKVNEANRSLSVGEAVKKDGGPSIIPSLQWKARVSSTSSLLRLENYYYFCHHHHHHHYYYYY